MNTNNTQSCLSSVMINQLVYDEVSPAELRDIEDHVTECEQCRQLLNVSEVDNQWNDDDLCSILRTPVDTLPPDDIFDCGVDSEELADGEELSSLVRLLGPTDDPHMMGRIGPYEVVGIIGRGGMGVVFKAFDAPLNRYVAIKMLLPHLAVSSAARRRFAREAQAAAAVIDDNVMPIYSVAECREVPYLVTQYCSGVTLQKRVQQQGPLGLTEILRVGMQTARGLAAAHAQGLVHRDVKPSNILLDGTVERATLTDFELARAVDDASITRTGVVSGTPQYMSPEQARGQSVDARSDLFGLGCVLYAMCTGQPPFRADNSYAILRLITDEEPQAIREINPSIPNWLRRIVERLMKKQADDRYATADEVAELLEECLAHLQQPEVNPLPAALVTQTSFFQSHRRGVMTMFGSFGFALLGLLVWQGTAPSDVAGKWTSDDWGTVVLEQIRPTQYSGVFQGPDNSLKGAISLKWSRAERRFNGTWQEGKEYTGKISLRRTGDEIRGGWKTDKSTAQATGWPRLADFTWRPLRQKSGAPAAGTDIAKLEVIASPEGTCLKPGPPEPLEILKALELQRGIKGDVITKLYASHEDDFRIVVEPAYDRVESPRHYPLVGMASMHRRRFRCEVHFAESDSARWPIKKSDNEKAKETFYIDRDHLHRSTSQAMTDVIQPGQQLAAQETKRPQSHVEAAERAWQSESYIPPNFDGFFPDDVEGGVALDRLFKAADKDARGDDEIVATVRNGLRRASQHRTSILRWLGNKYIWGKSPQNPDAVEIMYHAADFSGPRADPYGTRHYAVYFGLSVVQPKTSAILRTLAELSMNVDDPNDLSRVQWGAQSQQKELLTYLEPFRKSDDDAIRTKAEVCRRIFTQELKAFAWAAEQAKIRAQKDFADQLPQIRESLESGSSSDRKKTLQLIFRNAIASIMDDSFLSTLAKCAEDEDHEVRNSTTILVGGRWIWGARPQHPDAISLMLKLSEDPVREVRYNAVYYGLSTIRGKSDQVVRRLLEMAFADRERNLFGRIEWGLSSEPDRVATVLRKYIDGSDPGHAKAAREIFRKLTGRDPS